MVGEDVEEAGSRKTLRIQDPHEPDEETREEHQRTHLPYRNWCRHCVMGRGKEMDHRRQGAPEEHGVAPGLLLPRRRGREQGSDYSGGKGEADENDDGIGDTFEELRGFHSQEDSCLHEGDRVRAGRLDREVGPGACDAGDHHGCG